MKHKVKEETIIKYYNALVDLKNILTYTNRISLDGFCEKNHISKNLSRVLQKGGIIKCNTKGRYSEWEWTTVEPSKHMAVKAIQMLGIENPIRQPKQFKVNVKENVNTDVKVVTRRTKVVEPVIVKEKINVLITLFWGLFKIELC